MYPDTKTYIVFGIIVFVAICIVAMNYGPDYGHEDVKNIKTSSAASTTAPLEDQPLSKAGYKFAVNNIRLSGNQVSFTIVENAREHDKKADAVVLSGMYAGDKAHADVCPVVDSHYVDKEVEDYSAMSGKAEVVATFDDANVAKAAAEKGCLLIQDNG